MAIHYVRPDTSGELSNPFDCDELIVKALVTVSAFVALADGRLDAIERDEAVSYIEPACAEYFPAAHCRVLRRTRAASRKQRFRGFNCRGAPASSGVIVDV
jgi:hypothetical protein